MAGSQRRWRLGFIGAGANTRRRHLPGFAALPDVELVAVANRSVASGAAVARTFGIGRVERDWRSIVAAADVDAVCIGTWPDTHAEMTVAALQAGKSVLVEARMARSVAEADGMLGAAAGRPELVAQIVPSPFTLQLDAAIRRGIGEGRLGELREIDIEHRTGVNRDPRAPLTWRQDERISGVNTLSLGIVYEALLRWLPGDGTVVAADAAVFTRRRRDGAGRQRIVRVPDAVTVLGRWTGGARLTIRLSSVEPGPECCVYRLVGSEGRLQCDASSGTAWWVDARGQSERLATAGGGPADGWRVEAEFVESLRDGAPVTRTDFATGRRYMAFTEAAWRAWQGRL